MLVKHQCSTGNFIFLNFLLEHYLKILLEHGAFIAVSLGTTLRRCSLPCMEYVLHVASIHGLLHVFRLSELTSCMSRCYLSACRTVFYTYLYISISFSAYLILNKLYTPNNIETSNTYSEWLHSYSGPQLRGGRGGQNDKIHNTVNFR